jgi:hypothetical protein
MILSSMLRGQGRCGQWIGRVGEAFRETKFDVRSTVQYFFCADQATGQSGEAAVRAVAHCRLLGGQVGGVNFSPEGEHLAAELVRCDGDWPAARDTHELRKAVEINSYSSASARP